MPKGQFIVTSGHGTTHRLIMIHRLKKKSYMNSLFIFGELENKPKVSCTLDKHSVTELHPNQPYINFLINAKMPSDKISS
jgi:hypothetical protein